MSDFNFCGIIYIQTSPEICNQRIKLRNRKGEENIPIEYSIKCHKYHEDWINCLNKINDKPCDKIYFNGNINFKDTIPKKWYNELNSLLSKHYMIDNNFDWRLTKNQNINLKKGNKYFDHYQYYDNNNTNDEKITQKDCFSNSFV